MNVSGISISGKRENYHEISANNTAMMRRQVRDKMILQPRQSPSNCKNTHNPTGRCSSAPSNREDNWLCDHYQRRCFVKFECCDKYWACHRCHNNKSTCGQRKLKSRHTVMIKCVECEKEQQVIKLICT